MTSLAETKDKKSTRDKTINCVQSGIIVKQIKAVEQKLTLSLEIVAASLPVGLQAQSHADPGLGAGSRWVVEDTLTLGAGSTEDLEGPVVDNAPGVVRARVGLLNGGHEGKAGGSNIDGQVAALRVVGDAQRRRYLGNRRRSGDLVRVIRVVIRVVDFYLYRENNCLFICLHFFVFPPFYTSDRNTFRPT